MLKRFNMHLPIRTKSLCALLLLIAALVLATGCSNNPYSKRDSTASILYVVFGDDPDTLDPSIAYNTNSIMLASLVYGTYYQYDYLKRNPFVLVPALGAEDAAREKYPVTVTERGKSVTRSGERWTFRIKPGLHFQDDPCFTGGKGREIVGSDFLAAFRRMADSRIPCPIYSYFGDKIVGMEEYRAALADVVKSGKDAARAADTLPIEGLQTDPNDRYVFRIMLNQSYPQLRYLMALPFTAPLAHEAIARYGDERLGKSVPDRQKLSLHPVGCGPFIMTEYVKKSRVVLKRNPNYRDDRYPGAGEPGDAALGLLKDAGHRLPLEDGIQINIIREGITSFNQFMQGYEDIAGVSQQNYQQVMTQPGTLSPEMKSRGFKILHAPAVDISYFGFNMRDPTYGGFSEKNRKLRQAISLSIDSREMIDLLNLGLGIQAQSILAPGLFGYEESYKNPYCQFDPKLTRAKQLLSEAGYPNGIDPSTGRPLVLNWENLNTSPAGKQMTGLVTRQISRLGIDVQSHAWLYATFTDRLNKGQFQFMSWGWGPDYPDPENFVFLLYGPNSAMINAGPNSTNYANPEYDRLFEQMRVMDDGPERLAIIRKMRAIVQEDCPVIPWLHNETYTLLQPWLHDVKPHAVAPDRLKYYSVDSGLRARLRAEWNQPNYLPAVALLLLASATILPAVRVVHARTNRKVRRGLKG